MSDGDKKSETDLFREAMDDVKPIEQDQASLYHKRRRPEPLNLPVGDEDEESLADSNIETPEFLDFM